MLAQLWTTLKAALSAAPGRMVTAALVLWRGARGALLSVLEIVAALVLLFEEWGWRPLADLLGRLARFRLVRRLELAIAGLPPYAALAALALPTSVLLPLKFVALYLLANGHALPAAALFTGAKIASTALIARIFLLTKPSLMQIGWFARLHDWIVPWQEAMFAAIRSSYAWRMGRMLKNRARKAFRVAWEGIKPELSALAERARRQMRGFWSALRPRLASEASRLRLALRRAWERLL